MKFRTVLTTVFISGGLAVGAAQGEVYLATKLKKRCSEILSKGHTADIDMARDYYFYGDRCVSTSKEKKAWHTKGLEASKKAVKGAVAPEQLALAHYYVAINLSRWSLANGIRSSLSKWSEVEGHLEKVVEHGVKTVDYGAYRAYGRAYYKLPFLWGGSYQKSEKYLDMAYAKTLHPTFNTSTNVLTTLYYLHTLHKLNKDDVFCTVYDKLNALMPFNEEKAMKLNPHRILENMLDMQDFAKPPKSDTGEYIEEVREHADINC